MHQPSHYILTDTSEERMCIGKYIFIVAFILLTVLYISYTNRIINSLLSSFSVFSVGNKNYSPPTPFLVQSHFTVCMTLSIS